MNITKQIAELIGGEIEKLILDNEEIQFYHNNKSVYGYRWKDERYPESSNIWDNEHFKDKIALIRHFRKHINSKKPKTTIQYKRNIPPELKTKMDDYLQHLKNEKYEE